MLQFLIVMFLIHLIFKKGLNLGAIIFGALGLVIAGFVLTLTLGVGLLGFFFSWI